MLLVGRLAQPIAPIRRSVSNVVALSHQKYVPHKNVAARHVQKPPLLILHGLFGSKSNWKAISSRLSARVDRPVYALDLRNHGESPSSEGCDSNLDAMAADLLHFVEENRLEQVCLLGHSLGGRVAAQFAFNWPDKVDRLILGDIMPINYLPPVPFLEQDFFNLLSNSVEALSPGTKLSTARMQVAASLHEFLQDRNVVAFLAMSLRAEHRGAIRWRFDVEQLRRLVQNGLINQLNARQTFNGQALLVYGEESPFVRWQDFECIEKVMPNIQYVSLPNTGHYLHIEQPVPFLDSIATFLHH